MRGEGCSPGVPRVFGHVRGRFKHGPYHYCLERVLLEHYTPTTWYANYITALCPPILDKGTAMCWTIGLGSYLWSETAYMSAINEKRRVKQIAPPCGL